MNKDHTEEFRPIYDDCDTEGCEVPCKNPEQCSKKSPWSHQFKKIAFLLIIIVASAISIQKIIIQNSKEKVNQNLLSELPELSETEAAEFIEDVVSESSKEIQEPKVDKSVTFIYLAGNNNSINKPIQYRLDEASDIIQNAGGNLELIKLNQEHDHFKLFSNRFKLTKYPALIIFGPSCCSKYLIDDEFTLERFVEAYEIANASANRNSDSGNSSCDETSCK